MIGAKYSRLSFLAMISSLLLAVGVHLVKGRSAGRRVPVCLRSQFAISKILALQRTGYGAYQVRLRLARDMHLAVGEPVL